MTAHNNIKHIRDENTKQMFSIIDCLGALDNFSAYFVNDSGSDSFSSDSLIQVYVH